jgi:hypothetical protein
VALSARYPKTTNSAAENGSRLHGLSATALNGGERVYGAEDAKVIDPYVADVLREHWSRPGSELRVEKEAHWALNSHLKGTPDAVLIDPVNRVLIIWDLKTGWRLVEAVLNWQMICYAIMLCPPQWAIQLRIVQPLPYHPDGAVRSWSVTWAELMRLAVRVDVAVKDVMSPNAPLRPGRHCLYCEALVGCPAARDVALSAVEYAATEPVDLPDEYVGREIQVLRETLKILELRVGALEEATATKLRAGVNIPGVMMREGNGGRVKWAVDENVARFTLQMLTGSDPAIPTLPTPTQLKNAGVPDAMLRHLTKYQPGKMVLSTDADDRAKKIFGNEPNMEHTTS